MISTTTRRPNVLRLLGWGAIATMLAVPAIAMALGAPGVDWDVADFVIASVLLASAGAAAEALVRLHASWSYRVAALLMVTVTFFMIWANLAVGVVGNEANPFNLAYFALVPVIALGTLFVRAQPAGMARVALLAMVMVLVLLATAFLTGNLAVDARAIGVIVMHGLLAGGYGAVARLFHAAAQTDERSDQQAITQP